VVKIPNEKCRHVQESERDLMAPKSSIMKPLNILLLCNRPSKGADASTVTDHLDDPLATDQSQYSEQDHDVYLHRVEEPAS
jgi:hypothetical protein